MITIWSLCGNNFILFFNLLPLVLGKTVIRFKVILPHDKGILPQTNVLMTTDETNLLQKSHRQHGGYEFINDWSYCSIGCILVKQPKAHIII